MRRWGGAFHRESKHKSDNHGHTKSQTVCGCLHSSSILCQQLPSTPHLNLYRERCGHCLPQTKEGTHSQNCAVSRWSFWDSFVQRQITHIPVMDLEGFGKLDAEQTGIQHSSVVIWHIYSEIFSHLSEV